MRRSLLVLTIALTAALAACTSSTAPGWTFAPPTPPPAVTPAPSVDPSAPASGAPSAPASGAPSAPASGAPSAAPSDNGGGGSGEPILISALGIKFEQAEVAAPADAPFVIRFDNKDAGIPHNVEIKDASGASVFKGEIFNGAEVRDYQVGALAAGTYQFICTVHPNMVGTLTVGG